MNDSLRLRFTVAVVYLVVVSQATAEDFKEKNEIPAVTIPLRNSDPAYKAIIVIRGDERIFYRNQLIVLEDLVEALKRDGISADSSLLLRVDSNCSPHFFQSVVQVLVQGQPGRREVTYSLIPASKTKDAQSSTLRISDY